jgi:hypothetical protein
LPYRLASLDIVPGKSHLRFPAIDEVRYDARYLCFFSYYPKDGTNAEPVKGMNGVASWLLLRDPGRKGWEDLVDDTI